MSIITLEDYNNDKDCPELVDMYNFCKENTSLELSMEDCKDILEYEEPDDWNNFADSF